MLNKKLYLAGLVLIIMGLFSGLGMVKTTKAAISPTSCMVGDVNNDGVINNTDLDLLKQAVAGAYPFNLAEDLDGDGVAASTDVTLMKYDLAQTVNPLVAAPISCSWHTADLTYSKDGGATWGSNITVSNGDTLLIKATFNAAMRAGIGSTPYDWVYASIDNGLVNHATMTLNSPTEYEYSWPVSASGNISPATVSINEDFGEISNQPITLTSGANFNIYNGAYASYVPGSCIVGDANGDGVIDTNDLDLIKQAVAGAVAPNLAEDIDGDGVPASSDVSLMKLDLSKGPANPLVTSPISCAWPTASVTYSKDGGTTWATTATVKKGDSLLIKVTLSAAMRSTPATSAYQWLWLSVDNGIASHQSMTKNTATEFVYSLPITVTSNINPATVSVAMDFGAISGQALTLTSGTTFRIINPTAGGGSGSSGGGTLECSAVTYSDWSNCNNGFQTRSVLTQSPDGCTLNAAMQATLQQSCSASGQGNNQGNNNSQGGQVLGEKYVDPRELQLSQIYDDAHYIWPGDINLLLGYMGESRNLALEQTMASKYGSILGANVSMASLEAFNQAAITNFLTYGTKTTLALGAGERAGVLNSYKAAFGALPKTEEQWRDAIKIANGRWPSQVSAAAEKLANVNFKIVYKRNADMSNSNDNAAVTTMAYGLRPQPRNLNSEKSAIKIFKGVYGYYPVKATAWDVVRAIAYSGAIR